MYISIYKKGQNIYVLDWFQIKIWFELIMYWKFLARAKLIFSKPGWN